MFIGKQNSVNIITPLLQSDIVWPKVITLSGAYSNNILLFNFFSRTLQIMKLKFFSLLGHEGLCLTVFTMK
jgi:hypothetical protein